MEYGKRKPVMKRKPSLVIAIGMPKPDLKEKGSEKMPEAPKDEESLTCPKCGAELADTPENRKYAKMRAEEMDEDEDEESEDSEYDDSDD